MQVGSIIAGKFRLERVIGRGAMGVVLEATDLTLARRVALKLILPHHAADPQLRGRFVREADVMTRLRTEHVARIFETGELEDGTLFLAMELLEGQSLEQLIQSGGPLPASDAVDLMLEALDAVAEAHELGLIHRDIKPLNLFLAARQGADPILKVLDFGIVKDSSARAKLTATGTLPGTPAYMAPEQIGLEEHLIDARADVWALGVTFYELLTGSLPFAGPINVMLAKIRSEAPPRLRATRPDVAPELEDIVLRCLQKHPRDRFANARELSHALHELRGRGLARSERGATRQPIETEASLDRKLRTGGRGTVATQLEAKGAAPRPVRTLPISLLVIGVCIAVGFLLGVQGERRPTLSPGFTAPAALPDAAASALREGAESGAPSSETAALVSSASPLASAATMPSATRLATARRRKHVRVVSATNTGDAAWRSWTERHRQRLDVCGATQSCVALVTLLVTKVGGKASVRVHPNANDSACVVQPAVVACLTELTRASDTPLPDVCVDDADCHAEVLLAFE